MRHSWEATLLPVLFFSFVQGKKQPGSLLGIFFFYNYPSLASLPLLTSSLT